MEIVYSVPANAFKPGSNTATYTLPAGVYPKGDLSGNITDSTGTIIGTFALSKNPLRSHLHLVTTQVGRSPAPSSLIPRSITLRPVATARYIWARKPHTIEPEYSLNTKKEHTLSEDKSKVSYTVTVNAPNGTHDQTVTITDRLAREYRKR